MRIGVPAELGGPARTWAAGLGRRGVRVTLQAPEQEGSTWTLGRLEEPDLAREGVAVLTRPQPRDVLVVVEGTGIQMATLPSGSRVGTPGRLRAELLAVHRPDLETVRLDGLEEIWEALGRGDLLAAVLPAQAVARAPSSVTVHAAEVLEPVAWLTAAGEDALCLWPTAGDSPTTDPPAAFEDAAARSAVAAEYAARSALRAATDAPLGVLAVTHGEALRMRALVPRGDERRLVRAEYSGRRADPEAAGRRLAAILIARGAAALAS